MQMKPVHIITILLEKIMVKLGQYQKYKAHIVVSIEYSYSTTYSNGQSLAV